MIENNRKDKMFTNNSISSIFASLIFISVLFFQGKRNRRREIYRQMKFRSWITTILCIWIIINNPMGKGMLLNLPSIRRVPRDVFNIASHRGNFRSRMMKDTFRKFRSEISPLLLMNYILHYFADTKYNYDKGC